jgi:hypothetical protein
MASNSARSIVIPDATAFYLNEKKFWALMNASKKLQNLDIQNVPAVDFEMPQVAWVLRQLQSFTMSGNLRFPNKLTFLTILLNHAMDTIERVSIDDVPTQLISAWPKLPKLKQLRLRLNRPGIKPSRGHVEIDMVSVTERPRRQFYSGACVVSD